MKATPNSSNKHPVEVAPAGLNLREQIEKRTYHLWLTGGGGRGDQLRHWLQAEGEILKTIKQEQEERATAGKTKPTAKPRSAPVSNDTVINK